MNRSAGWVWVVVQAIGSSEAMPVASIDAISITSERSVSPHRKAVQLLGQEYILPQFVIGGEWISTIKITNRGTKAFNAIPFYLNDNNGLPLNATFRLSDGRVITDSAFTVSLSIGGILEATFAGGRDAQFGHVFIGCPATGPCETPGLYSDVTLRNRNATRPDFESVFPVEQPYATQYLGVVNKLR